MKNIEEEPDGEESPYRNLVHISQTSPHSHKGSTHIKAIPKLQPLLATHRRSEQSLSSLAEDAANKEEHERRHDQRRSEEMAKYKDEGDLDRLAGSVGVGDAPCYTCQEEEEGKEVGECWIWAVVGVFRFYAWY